MPTESEKHDYNELMYLKKLARERPNDIYYKNRITILQRTLNNQLIISSQLRKYKTVPVKPSTSRSKKTASTRSRTSSRSPHQ